MRWCTNGVTRVRRSRGVGCKLRNSVYRPGALLTRGIWRAGGENEIIARLVACGQPRKSALPDGLRTMISGIGVFYPDKQPTQRVGIIFDIVVKPTIKDVRTGRDPVLEKAIRMIVGSKVPESRIRAMYQDHMPAK